MAGGFWSAGDTNVLASRGMNQDQSGWDSLQSWYDEKAKREREAAETARKAEALRQMAEEEEADRRKALGIQLRERLTDALKAQGRTPGREVMPYESWLVANNRVDPAALSEARASSIGSPDGSVPVVGTSTDREEYDRHKARIDEDNSLFSDRFKKAEDLIAAGFNPYTTDEGEVYSTLDNAKMGLRVGMKAKREDIKKEKDKAEAEAAGKLDELEKAYAIEMLEMSDLPREDIEKIKKTGDIQQEILRIQDAAAKGGQTPAEADAMKKKFGILVGAINGAMNRMGGAKAKASMMTYRRGIDAEEAMARLDDQYAQGEDAILGTSYDSMPTLQRLASKYGQMDPNADPTKNPFLSRLTNQTKGEYKLDDTRLRTIMGREKNANDLARDARKWEAQADSEAVKIAKDMEALDKKIKSAEKKGKNDYEIAKMKAEYDAYMEAMKGYFSIYRARIGQQNTTISTAGLIMTLTKDPDLAKRLTDAYNIGTNVSATNVEKATLPLRDRFSIGPMGVQGDPVFGETAPTLKFGPLAVGGGKTTVTPGAVAPSETPPAAPPAPPAKGAKKDKKATGTVIPYDKDKVTELDAMVASGTVKKSVAGDIATYTMPSGRVFKLKTR